MPHSDAVSAILTSSADPQVTTASRDATIKLWDLVAGKEMTTLTHHKKGLRALCASGGVDHSFVSASGGDIRRWACRTGALVGKFEGHEAVINAVAANGAGVLASCGDDGSMRFWDYLTGYCFQRGETAAQPGSLDAERGVFAASFDHSGTRLVTGEADKSIKIWKEKEDISEEDEPIDMAGWRKTYIEQSRQRI